MQVLPRILPLANILQDVDVSSKLETFVDIDMIGTKLLQNIYQWIIHLLYIAS